MTPAPGGRRFSVEGGREPGTRLGAPPERMPSLRRFPAFFFLRECRVSACEPQPCPLSPLVLRPPIWAVGCTPRRQIVVSLRLPVLCEAGTP